MADDYLLIKGGFRYTSVISKEVRRYIQSSYKQGYIQTSKGQSYIYLLFSACEGRPIVIIYKLLIQSIFLD